MTPLLIYVTIVTTFLPILPLSIYWRTRVLQAHPIKYVAGMLLLSTLTDMQGMLNYFFRYSEIATTFTNTVYAFLSFILLVLLYRSLLPKEWRSPIAVVSFLILVTGTYLIVSSNDRKFLNNGFMTITWIPVILFSLIFFFRMIKDLPATDIRRLPMFWINTAFLAYFSGNLILQIFRDYLRIVSPDLFSAYLIFHNISWGILCILISIGLWQVRKVAN